MSEQRPKVGVATIILNAEGKLLVGKRKGSHGAGTWQLPGGHLEAGEDPLRCAERESEEETGLKIKASKIVAVTNDIFETENKHYITLFALSEMADPDAVPQLLEPNKCEGWHWKTWNEIKLIGESASSNSGGEQLFLPMVNLLKQAPDFNDLITRAAL